ncbi:MAG: hypothetical protein ABIE23_06710 [archaeon]|nr:hypothetical protein [Candidatus Micrarchaeota archaeon]
MKKIVLFSGIFILLLFSGCIFPSKPNLEITSLEPTSSSTMDLFITSNQQMPKARIELSDNKGSVFCAEYWDIDEGINRIELSCSPRKNVTVTLKNIPTEAPVQKSFILPVISEFDLREEAIELAETTIEAELMELMNESLKRIDDCTTQEYIDSLDQVSVEMGTTYSPPPPEMLPQIDEAVETAKECKPVMEKEAEKIGENLYKVSYVMKVTPSCSLPKSVSTSDYNPDSMIEMEVDLKYNTVEVTKGGMKEPDEQQIQQWKRMMKGLGNCAALFFVTSRINTPTTPSIEEVPGGGGEAQTVKIYRQGEEPIDVNVVRIDENFPA